MRGQGHGLVLSVSTGDRKEEKEDVGSHSWIRYSYLVDSSRMA
jgi:hypothetical protein